MGLWKRYSVICTIQLQAIACLFIIYLKSISHLYYIAKVISIYLLYTMRYTSILCILIQYLGIVSKILYVSGHIIVYVESVVYILL